MSDIKVVYDVATNFDPMLVHAIARNNGDRIFETMFGKLRSDFFGGGRSSQTLPDVSLDDIAAYIKLCHDNKLEFNYLMNPVCTGNREVFPSDHQEMLAFIDKIVALGIDGVTVNSPLLCPLIKKRHPNIKITIGLYAWIFTIKQVAEWKALGADVLTLGFSVTRDFPLLDAMMKLAKKLDIKLRLIANNGCLKDCSYKNSHATELAHSSQHKEAGSEFFVDYNMLQCNYNKMTSPHHLIASDWIRPEDVVYYEELCKKVGFEGFSIKLLDRWKSTEFLTRVVEAYAKRSFDGNLLDLMSFPKEGKVKYSFNENVRLTMKYGFNPTDMMKLGPYFQFPDLYIDNKKLDGFLELFVKGFQCADKVCKGPKTEGLAPGSVCNYCSSWAAQAITFDAEKMQAWKENADSLLDAVKTSRIFCAAAPAAEE